MNLLQLCERKSQEKQGDVRKDGSALGKKKPSIQETPRVMQQIGVKQKKAELKKSSAKIPSDLASPVQFNYSRPANGAFQ